MNDVAMILAGTAYAQHLGKVNTYLDRESGQTQTIMMVDVIERKGYSYNHAVALWIEFVAHGFHVTGIGAHELAEGGDYLVFCKARLRVKAL
jgi:hypothetical protein